MTLVFILDDVLNNGVFYLKFIKMDPCHAPPKEYAMIIICKTKQNKTKQYGSNIFRPLYDMNNRELRITTEKIIQGPFWLSTIVDCKFNANTLL